MLPYGVRRVTAALLLVNLLAVGCVVEERLVPRVGTGASWRKVADAEKLIKRGMSKSKVRSILGPPVSMSARSWQYRVYGKKIAEAYISFDDKGRVVKVKSVIIGRQR